MEFPKGLNLIQIKKEHQMENKNWSLIKNTTPPHGIFVYTKIEDEKGSRNEQKLKFENNLWFCEDGTYIYYKPTHWAPIESFSSSSFSLLKRKESDTCLGCGYTSWNQNHFWCPGCGNHILWR